VLVLALDTATPTVTVGIVELGHAPVELAGRVREGARKHVELLMPAVLDAAAEAGVGLADLDAVVVGTGPGPFTGLRVGMVTAAAIGDAVDVPVHGVCSLDAIAVVAAAPRFGGRTGEGLLVVTDARRREVYWAAYDGGARRTAGPEVQRPAALRERLSDLGVVAAAGGAADGLGLPVLPPVAPTPVGLASVAASALLTGAEPEPLTPLYLRRPDAVVPGERKRVTA
jgi:tRNA threonylcarbamoyl adenosine modification protein YeaZ